MRKICIKSDISLKQGFLDFFWGGCYSGLKNLNPFCKTKNGANF